jgi:hypothetical protein
MSAMPARTPAISRTPVRVPIAKKSTRKRIIKQIKPAFSPALETIHEAIPNGKASNRVFTLFICGVATIGLLLLLLVNNMSAKASFEKLQLQHQVSELLAQEQQLQRTVSYQESPGQLLVTARKMGMVPAATPAFLRLSDHKILGVPQAALAGQ